MVVVAHVVLVISSGLSMADASGATSGAGTAAIKPQLKQSWRRPSWRFEVDGAYLGRERHCAAVSLNDAGHPRHMKLATMATYSFAAIADWSQDSLATGCEVKAAGLACFRAVAEVGCSL